MHSNCSRLPVLLYRTSMGSSLWRHPFGFTQDLAHQKIATCADVLAARDGTWLTVAGAVLVRQCPPAPAA